MPTPDDCHDTVTEAMAALTSACRQWGPETVRDALTEIRDTPDDDATSFDAALLDAVADAISEAQDTEEGRTRIAILTPDGARITWSWIGDTRPDRDFETMVMNSVARTLGMHIPGDDDHTDAPEEVTGTIPGPHGRSVRYRIGHECGDIFAEDEDFNGLTLTIETPSIEGAEALLANINAIGGSGLWPCPTH